MSTSQFGLLKQRRFAALFWTQFLGAFNDNVFKQALVLIFVFGGLINADTTDVFVNLAAGLFILPFFLFSATAGQIADKVDKSGLIRQIKLAEIVIMSASRPRTRTHEPHLLREERQGSASVPASRVPRASSAGHRASSVSSLSRGGCDSARLPERPVQRCLTNTSGEHHE